ncbi:MAG: hypothetical protein ABTQ73_10630 [Caldilineales bacterium]
MAPLESSPGPSAPRPPAGLSFGDGFQFGCGFFAAGLIATIVLALVLALLSFVLSLTGFSLLSLLAG